jgi:hypothetical protein
LAGASSTGTVTFASSLLKEVYNPKAVIPHAASLHQACAHCAIFPTAASRRSLGRISVPVWPDTLSGRLPVVALVGHHPTNKLIGRGPIPHRKSFPPPGHATSRVYSVLDPVSQAYPKVQGRSPTCYSPVRHSSHPASWALSVRLACVKHAASVRPEPGSNSPNKNPSTTEAEFKSEKPDIVRKTDNKKHHTQGTGRQECGQNKKQQTKTTKHTIEFSNNTPVQQATLPLYSTWSETSNPVRQCITGAVGFSEQTTPVRAEAPKRIDEPAFRAGSLAI